MTRSTPTLTEDDIVQAVQKAWDLLTLLVPNHPVVVMTFIDEGGGKGHFISGSNMEEKDMRRFLHEALRTQQGEARVVGKGTVQ